MARFEDYELAQTIKRELQQLRSRPQPATSPELDVIAARVAIPANWQKQSSRTVVDEVRARAWLAICGLAGMTADNEAATSENRSDKIIDTDPLWAVAIDRVDIWIIEAE